MLRPFFHYNGRNQGCDLVFMFFKRQDNYQVCGIVEDAGIVSNYGINWIRRLATRRGSPGCQPKSFVAVRQIASRSFRNFPMHSLRLVLSRIFIQNGDFTCEAWPIARPLPPTFFHHPVRTIRLSHSSGLQVVSAAVCLPLLALRAGSPKLGSFRTAPFCEAIASMIEDLLGHLTKLHALKAFEANPDPLVILMHDTSLLDMLGFFPTADPTSWETQDAALKRAHQPVEVFDCVLGE